MELSESTLLEFKIELERLITKREGMIAENTRNEMAMIDLKYRDYDFDVISSLMNDLLNSLLKLKNEKRGEDE